MEKIQSFLLNSKKIFEPKSFFLYDFYSICHLIIVDHQVYKHEPFIYTFVIMIFIKVSYSNIASYIVMILNL